MQLRNVPMVREDELSLVHRLSFGSEEWERQIFKTRREPIAAPSRPALAPSHSPLPHQLAP
jgi:hypothetical protein